MALPCSWHSIGCWETDLWLPNPCPHARLRAAHPLLRRCSVPGGGNEGCPRLCARVEGSTLRSSVPSHLAIDTTVLADASSTLRRTRG